MSILWKLWEAIGPGGEFLVVLSAFVGGGALILRTRDLANRGMLRRRARELARHPTPVMLAHGLVPCPECAEAILPSVARCPYCDREVTALTAPPREIR